MIRRPTRADVADKAGVSKTTVTYVVSRRQDVAIPEATRKRVLAVAEQLGYTPHAAARALANGRTNTVTVALPIRIVPHYARALQTFERHANTHGYHMIASTIGHVSLDNVRPDLCALLNGLIDGLILVDMPGTFQRYVADLLPAEKPVVSVGVFTVPNTDCVEINLTPGATQAMQHLLAAKPGRVALFGPGISDPGTVLKTFAAEGSVDPRVEAYLRAMDQAGRPYEIIHGSPADRKTSMAALKEYVKQSGCPAALFCLNDEMALSAHRALREMGYRIPQDVAIVGCDGSEEGEYVDPPLTTIVQPMEQVCSMAWDFLSQRLSGRNHGFQRARLDAPLVIRGSS